ncbi:glycosyltransferase family 4 protein [Prochlorococcus marinus]|uniref:glycosyltransferase family 4 protein n=1 Tax=Prochlorococcus marinus TaxID=1219 RepID=UPI001ADBEAFA|nr:glycosyltransferase family 4 protein [Prochlorococcus marinus]MBO8204937.1 glycosyltransferase family 4 protein [Prochlorococcus marinus CUG1415]MBW3044209.1 hypothetical protein [Prochlorococcus marinus str. MU1415]
MNVENREVLIVNYAFSIFRGGGENFDLNICKEFNLSGINSSIVTVDPFFCKNKPATIDGIKIKYVRAFWFYDFSSYLKSINPKLSGVGYAMRILGQFSFEISVIFFIIRQKRNKNLLVLTTFLPFLTFFASNVLNISAYMRSPGPLLSPYERIFFRFIKVLCNGDAYRKLVKDYPNQVNYVEIGVGKFILPKTNKINDNNFTEIAIVGRLIPIKGIGQLLKILKIVNSIYPLKIHIFGDGVLKNKLVSQSFKLKLNNNVIMHGFLEKEKLYESLENLDCLLMNSKYDNFPNVLVEANALGLPVWAPNVGGIDLIIENRVNGFIVNKNLNINEKAESICEFIKFIKDGKFDSVEISRKCQMKFDWKRTIQNILELTN